MSTEFIDLVHLLGILLGFQIKPQSLALPTAILYLSLRSPLLSSTTPSLFPREPRVEQTQVDERRARDCTWSRALHKNTHISIWMTPTAWRRDVPDHSHPARRSPRCRL